MSKCQKPYQDTAVGKLPGRSKADGGNEKEEEEEVRQMENEVMNAILTSGPIEPTARGDVAVVVEERNAETSSGGDVAEEPFQHVGQSWECSQIEDEFEETRKEEERITRRRSEGREVRVGRVQSVPELGRQMW